MKVRLVTSLWVGAVVGCATAGWVPGLLAIVALLLMEACLDLKVTQQATTQVRDVLVKPLDSCGEPAPAMPGRDPRGLFKTSASPARVTPRGLES